VPYDSPDVLEEGDEHPSKLAGDGEEFARDLRKLGTKPLCGGC